MMDEQCGCGGNVQALGVTSHRLVLQVLHAEQTQLFSVQSRPSVLRSESLSVQYDERCLFGTTPLTTKEESISLSHIHKASLHTGMSPAYPCSSMEGRASLPCPPFLS